MKKYVGVIMFAMLSHVYSATPSLTFISPLISSGSEAAIDSFSPQTEWKEDSLITAMPSEVMRETEIIAMLTDVRRPGNTKPCPNFPYSVAALTLDYVKPTWTEQKIKFTSDIDPSGAAGTLYHHENRLFIHAAESLPPEPPRPPRIVCEVLDTPSGSYIPIPELTGGFATFLGSFDVCKTHQSGRYILFELHRKDDHQLVMLDLSNPFSSPLHRVLETSAKIRGMATTTTELFTVVGTTVNIYSCDALAANTEKTVPNRPSQTITLPPFLRLTETELPSLSLHSSNNKILACDGTSLMDITSKKIFSPESKSSIDHMVQTSRNGPAIVLADMIVLPLGISRPDLSRHLPKTKRIFPSSNPDILYIVPHNTIFYDPSPEGILFVSRAPHDTESPLAGWVIRPGSRFLDLIETEHTLYTLMRGGDNRLYVTQYLRNPAERAFNDEEITLRRAKTVLPLSEK